MSIEKYWAQARSAQRAEVLALAGVPKQWLDVLVHLDWADLKPLTVAMLERAWETTSSPC